MHCELKRVVCVCVLRFGWACKIRTKYGHITRGGVFQPLVSGTITQRRNTTNTKHNSTKWSGSQNTFARIRIAFRTLQHCTGGGGGGVGGGLNV